MTEQDDKQAVIVVEDETLREGFTQIPNALLRRSDLSPGAKLTYMALLSYAWQQGRCFPGQDRLAQDLGAGKRSVIRYLQELTEAQLLKVQRRGLGQTNLYLLPRFTGPLEDSPRPRSAKLAHAEVPKSAVQEVPNLHLEKDSAEKDSVEQHPAKYLPHSSSDISISIRNSKTEKIRQQNTDEESPTKRATPASKGFTSAGDVLKQRHSSPTQAEQTTPKQPPATPRRTAPTKTPETVEQQAIRGYIQDLRQRFQDFAGENSSVTRAYHLYQKAQASHPDLDISGFTSYLEQAAAITAERGGELRYLFSVVESTDLAEGAPSAKRYERVSSTTPPQSDRRATRSSRSASHQTRRWSRTRRAFSFFDNRVRNRFSAGYFLTEDSWSSETADGPESRFWRHSSGLRRRIDTHHLETN